MAWQVPGALSLAECSACQEAVLVAVYANALYCARLADGHKLQIGFQLESQMDQLIAKQFWVGVPEGRTCTSLLPCSHLVVDI